MHKDRKTNKLKKDVKTDIVIVGGGIAGVTTAYFLLTQTESNVVLLESRLLAHGATGHNAGQVVSYFERSFVSIVEEFGLKVACEGQQLVEDAWSLLENMIQDAHIQIPFSQFVGYLGLSQLSQLHRILEDGFLKRKGGISAGELFLSEDVRGKFKIPAKFDGLYSYVPQAMILNLLQTKNSVYFAAYAERKGCMNSALFCEEVMGYLLSKFKKRFKLYEHSKVDAIKLYEVDVRLDVGMHEVYASKAVLCTNGFENFRILNMAGSQINTKFHDTVSGVVGFMAAYFDESQKPPTALSYYPSDMTADSHGDNYYYLTRRLYETPSGEFKNLISIGGPQIELEERLHYHREEQDHPDSAIDEINAFLKRDFEGTPDQINHEFRWHGLMGYTSSGLRVVGPDTVNPNLLYNLGCNGVGILTSIMGAKRIADFASGAELPKSIFDPK